MKTVARVAMNIALMAARPKAMRTTPRTSIRSQSLRRLARSTLSTSGRSGWVASDMVFLSRKPYHEGVVGFTEGESRVLPRRTVSRYSIPLESEIVWNRSTGGRAENSMTASSRS